MHMCYERPGLVNALNGTGYDKWERAGGGGGSGGGPGGSWAGRDRERDRERERQARAHQMSHAHAAEPDASSLFPAPFRVTGNSDRVSQQIRAKLGDYNAAQTLLDDPSKSIGICAEPASPAPCPPSRRESEFKKPAHAPQNGRVHHRPYMYNKSDVPGSTGAPPHRPPNLRISNGFQNQSAIDSSQPPIESILKEMKSLPTPLSVIAATPRKELENKFTFNPYTKCLVQETPQSNNDLKTPPLPKPGLDNRISNSRSSVSPDVVNKDLGLSESDDEVAATTTRLEPILSPIGSGGSPSSGSESSPSDSESESSSAESSGPAATPAEPPPAPAPPPPGRASWSLVNFAPPPAHPPDQPYESKELRHALADVKGKPVSGSPISELSDSEASSVSPAARRRQSTANRSSALSSDDEAPAPRNQTLAVRKRQSTTNRSSALSSDDEAPAPRNQASPRLSATAVSAHPPLKRGRPPNPKKSSTEPPKKKRGRPRKRPESPGAPASAPPVPAPPAPPAPVSPAPRDSDVEPEPALPPALHDTKTHIFRKVFTPKKGDEGGGKGGKGGKGKGGKGKGQVTIIEVTPDSDQRDNRERDIRERDTRERDTRERDTRERDTRERDTRERETRERDTRERDTRERETRERDMRERETRERDMRERDTRERETRERDTRERETRERDTRERETRERDGRTSQREARDRSAERRHEEALARVSPPPDVDSLRRREERVSMRPGLPGIERPLDRPERPLDRPERPPDRPDRPSDRTHTERTSNDRLHDRLSGSLTTDRISTARMLADRLSSPASLLTSPTGRLTSPAGRLTSPAGRLTSPAGRLTSPAGRSTSPAGRLTSPADRLTSPAGRLTSLAGRLTSPAGRLTDRLPTDRAASERISSERLVSERGGGERAPSEKICIEKVAAVERYVKAEADVGAGVKSGRGSDRSEEACSNAVERRRMRVVVRVPLARLRADTVRALTRAPRGPKRAAPASDTCVEAAATNHERAAGGAGGAGGREGAGGGGAGQTPIYYSYFERLPADALSDEERDHKYYLGEAVRLRAAAEREQEPLARVMRYLESVLCFVLTGRVLELELDTKQAFNVYRETIEYIKSIHSMPQRFRASPHSTFSKLDILSLRVQALLYLRMFKMYNREVKEYNKIVQDYQQKPACAESVSPLSPTPSPAGSVNSVGSASSGYCSLAHSVPAAAHHALLQLTKYYTFLYVAHELWEQADCLCRLRANQDLFIAVDRKCGPLTLFSTFRHLVQYVRHAISLLKAPATHLPARD